MFRAMKFHHQEVSCRIEALWYNVMSKYIWYIWYYGEPSAGVIRRMEQVHRGGSSLVVSTVSAVLSSLHHCTTSFSFILHRRSTFLAVDCVAKQ